MGIDLTSRRASRYNGVKYILLIFFGGCLLIPAMACKTGRETPAPGAADQDTAVVNINTDSSKTFQTMEGFGGFGAQDVYWGAGPFSTARFVDDLINDLGLTLLRDNIPLDFEITNDNGDPNTTDLSKYHVNGQTPGYGQPLSTHIQFLKDMKAAGLSKLITSIWSPMPWMKNNNSLTNGTSQNAAPPYNSNPTAADNQLRTDMYEEFAEMCVAYVKIIKQQTGLDVYALSIQNEPRFSQSYESCVYNGEALKNLLKTVGSRFKKEGIGTKLFLPEDVGYLDGVQGMIRPSLDDPDARQYVDVVAVHGYALDGVTANSPDAQTWQTMYSWGAAYGKPLWMTETSGFPDDFNGAMALGKAMLTAIKFGNVSAWLFWQLSQSKTDEFSLMNTAGAKSKRYYVSKNFYKFIRPGAIRFSAEAPDGSNVYAVAFRNSTDGSIVLVLINDDPKQVKQIKLSPAGLPTSFELYSTTITDNCADKGMVNTEKIFTIPANSVVTLVSR
ncbi:MAG: glycoside hydrolase family 30 beta sandwich domain-containing protein [Bacteroidota bacterium]|nr:glycoside hydrolase family 30 beta sandwich domain-containing protein [Bacteroidota bacterium]